VSGPDLTGRSVLLAGAGVTGVAAAAALLELGAAVTVTDADEGRLAALEAELPAARTAVALRVPPDGVSLVVTSPGWRPDAPLLVAAAAAGIEVIGDVELAWRICAARPDPPTWLVVTGTNGKTTTVGMLESILRAAGLDAVACGNVGLPVPAALHAKVLAVELSSFQLHWSPSVRPAAGLLLNIAPDHLDWHGGMAEYAAAKARALTGPIALAGVDEPVAAGMLAAAPAARRIGLTAGAPAAGQLGVTPDGVLLDRAFGDDTLAPVSVIRPAGPSGIADALGAAGLARAHGVPAAAIEAGLRAFSPGGHRGAVVGEHAGVRYLDDSKASNPHAAAAAIRGHDRVVWVAGGLLKGAGVDELVTEVAPRLAGAVLLGADREVIASALARHAPEVPVRTLEPGDHDAMTVMAQAVRIAGELARPGDVVLLAPAGASWDMFTDYAHRGRAFAAAVAELAGEVVR
jgi:UDP-N-acetylmuramoylalanine--D-glutamate ligase